MYCISERLENGAMLKLKINSASLVGAARVCIEEIETEDLVSRLSDPNLVVVDIRDIGEREQNGYIPGSFHAPRGMVEFWVDPDSPYFKPVFGEPKEFVFHCGSGLRSALTVATLQAMGFKASHLREGFATWQAHNGPVEFSQAY